MAELIRELEVVVVGVDEHVGVTLAVGAVVVGATVVVEPVGAGGDDSVTVGGGAVGVVVGEVVGEGRLRACTRQ